MIVCPEPEHQWEFHWPLLSIFGQVWIIHGMGTMQRRAGQGATPLEMARVKDAAMVVVPNRGRTSLTLAGDGETVQTVRNVQELVAGTEWHFTKHTTPKFLVELNVRHNTLYFRNSLQRPRIFASGQAYECQMLDTLLTQIFHSDATVSILEHSIGYWDGNGRYPFQKYEEAQPGLKPRSLESCHIEQKKVPEEFVGQRYEMFFKWALKRDALPIALYRFNDRHKTAQKVSSSHPCLGCMVATVFVISVAHVICRRYHTVVLLPPHDPESFSSPPPMPHMAGEQASLRLYEPTQGGHPVCGRSRLRVRAVGRQRVVSWTSWSRASGA